MNGSAKKLTKWNGLKGLATQTMIVIIYSIFPSFSSSFSCFHFIFLFVLALRCCCFFSHSKFLILHFNGFFFGGFVSLLFE